MAKRTTARVSNERGFTIAEVLVTSTLMAIVLVPIYTMFAAGQTTYNKGLDRAEIQQNARVALQWMAREIRMAGYESPNLATPACPAPKVSACVLPTQQASKIGIRADVDGDGVTEEVEYELQSCAPQNGVLVCNLVRRERDWDGATSTWGAWSAYETVAGNVEGLAVTYLPVASPTRVRVQVNVREPRDALDVAFMVVSDMQLRNR